VGRRQKLIKFPIINNWLILISVILLNAATVAMYDILNQGF